MLLNKDHAEWCENILYNIRRCDYNAAETLAQCLMTLYRVELVAMHLNFLIEFNPFPEITAEQWDALRDEIQVCHSYDALFQWIAKAVEFVDANLGGF